jgi:hypothetical protein
MQDRPALAMSLRRWRAVPAHRGRHGARRWSRRRSAAQEEAEAVGGAGRGGGGEAEGPGRQAGEECGACDGSDPEGQGSEVVGRRGGAAAAVFGHGRGAGLAEDRNAGLVGSEGRCDRHGRWGQKPCCSLSGSRSPDKILIVPKDTAVRASSRRADIAPRTRQAGIYNVVDDEPAPLREWLPVFAGVLGARPALARSPLAGAAGRG